jgi:hypothetical protein
MNSVTLPFARGFGKLRFPSSSRPLSLNHRFDEREGGLEQPLEIWERVGIYKGREVSCIGYVVVTVVFV